MTIISIVVGFVIGVSSLLFSFLQWHHPRPLDLSESSLRSLLQAPTFDSSKRLQLPGFPTAPQHKDVESNEERLPSPTSRSRHLDWGEAPQADQFYGREKERAELKRWLVEDHCRLVAILGMGGMGKMSLAAILVVQVQEHYDYVFWRFLHNAPPLESMLQECIQFLSGQQRTILPEEVDRQISLLLEYFRACHCLLVLDNVESILQGESQAGHYHEGHEEYGRLLQRIGEARHQSCLLVTSREKPKEVALLEGETATVRSYHLAGLPPRSGALRGQFCPRQSGEIGVYRELRQYFLCGV